ncbi:phosphotransferase [Mycolicibacterium thermoresistibile]|uniref:Phosphotransferase enzyme family protein n=1 Tax=Mycolicibacterium thermoresistibile TaxID=1797 RepID=A0A124E8G3_MYCTH|nr:phosphotransferase enzyme family protein [Mycolicibacterium thermoresistibile]
MIAAELVAAAGRHGLRLDPATVTVNEAGLDFRVALARAVDGVEWVLRVPRRPDAAERARVEAAVLEFVAPRLSVAVPEWRIQHPGADRLSGAAGRTKTHPRRGRTAGVAHRPGLAALRRGTRPVARRTARRPGR